MVKFPVSTTLLHFEVCRLLEGGAYFYMNSNDTTLIRGRLLFDARSLLEEIRYFYS